MKKHLKYSLHLGIFLCAGYQIINHIKTIPNLIAIPVLLISIAFMLIGLIQNKGNLCNLIKTK